MKHVIAFIGYGGMAGWHHSMIRENFPDFTVKGAYDIRPEVREGKIGRAHV